MPLLSGFGCFFKARVDFFIVCLEVRDRFFLVHEHLGSLGDIFEACFVLFAQLTKLSATEEELGVRETLAEKQRHHTYSVFVGWVGGAQKLSSCVWIAPSEKLIIMSHVPKLPCVRTFMGLST